MRILITGVAGLVGSELALQLHAQGHELIGCDDLSHNCREPYDLPLKRMLTCRVEQVFMFLSPLKDTHASPIDLIIHCASPVGHARLTPDADTAWQIIHDTRVVLDLAARQGARLITFSSSEVLTYRGETDARAQYSLGKLTSEAMVLGQTRVDARVIRPFNVTGKWQRADGGFVMARFRDQILAGKPLTTFGSGMQQRHFTHVSDFARFVELLVEKWPERRLWSVFNPANGTTIKNLVRLFELAHGQVQTVDADGREALGNPVWRDTPNRETDKHDFAACQGLGWEPKVGLEEIIAEHLSAGVEAANG